MKNKINSINQIKQKETWFILLIGISTLILLVFLGIYAYKGLFSRLLQDDYCYSGEVVRYGFFQAQIHSYFNPVGYNSNRFSLTLFSGIIDVFGGVKVIPYLAGIVILSWCLAALNLAKQLNQKFSISLPKISLLYIVLIIIFFSFYLAPELYQILYWRPALLPYLAPVVFFTWLATRLINYSDHTKLKPFHYLELGIISFLSAGFSETAAVLLLSCLSIYFLLIFLFKRASQITIKLGLGVMIPAILSTIILIICPVNAQRFQQIGFEKSTLFTILANSLENGYIFMKYTLAGQLSSFILILASGFFINAIHSERRMKTIKQIILQIIIIPLVCYICCVAVVLPFMIAMGTYPAPRTLFPSMVILIITVFLGGWTLADGVSFLLSNQIINLNFQIPAALIGLIVVVNLIYSTPQVSSEISALQSRATAWDTRHQILLDNNDSNEPVVLIPAFNSIHQVAEFRENQKFWVNKCGAKFYGVKGISAIEGHLDFPAHFK